MDSVCDCGCGESVDKANRLIDPGGDRPYPPPNPGGLCMCGCGEPTPLAKQTRRSDRIEKGQHLRFVVGHARRGTGTARLDRSTNRYRVHSGGKRTYRYRLVAEQMLGRPLRSDEVVHHINDDPTDDRPENLRVMTREDHTVLHNPRKGKTAH